MKKVAVVSKYKSEIMDYLKREGIEKEDVYMVCTQNDMRGVRGVALELVVLTEPWYGFDSAQAAKLLIAERKPEKYPSVSTDAELIADLPDDAVNGGSEPVETTIIGGDSPSNEEEVENIRKVKDEDRLNPHIMATPPKKEVKKPAPKARKGKGKTKKS